MSRLKENIIMNNFLLTYSVPDPNGTGGRKMKVMSTVIAWMELPDRYEGE